MVVDKICKMTVKGVKLKSESFFSISYGIFGVMEENPKKGGGGGAWIGLMLTMFVKLSFDIGKVQ